MGRFEFTQKERADLCKRLSSLRCNAVQLDQFLNDAQSNIKEWLREWPAQSCPPLGKRRDSLTKLASQSRKTRMMIELLPEHLDSLLWINFLGRLPPDARGKARGRGVTQRESNAFRNQTLEFLLDLERTAVDLQEQIGAVRGGADALRKVTLLKGLANSFFFAFSRRPATTPDGVFFGVTKEIEGMLAKRGFQMRIGKDVVGAAIDDCSSLFDFVEEQAARNSGKC